MVQISFAIGVAQPTSLYVELFGTGKVSNRAIEQAVLRVFPVTPAGIINGLDLRRPIYARTTAYGHFGRNEEGFTWEATDKVNELLKTLG
jgi:S-adenosylmethionine synthetase